MNDMDDYIKQTLDVIESKMKDRSVQPFPVEDLAFYALLKIYDKLQSMDGTLVLILSKMRGEE